MSRSEISQERKYSRIGRSTEPNIVEEEDLTIDFEYPDIQSVSQTGRSEDDKSSYMRSQTRFIKSQYPSKRTLPGSQSSRAYIEKSEYGVKSSAMSDTSEAPSLASHVRRVRVPSQASDVDQFLDELFMPVLDGNLDELSDARSLAASIKGTIKKTEDNIQDYLDNLCGNLNNNLSAKKLSNSIKGGGGNMDIPNQNTAFNFSPLSPSMMSPQMMMPMYHQSSPSSQQITNGQNSSYLPIPIYNMQGLNMPQYPNSPPNNQNPDIAAYQQNLQRAFLQSAMAQNLQIQQQLLAQNQAFQQLLVQNNNGTPQNISFDSEQQQQSNNNNKIITSTPTNQRLEKVTVKAQVHRSQSPPKKDIISRKISNEYASRKISIERKLSSTPDLKNKTASSGKGNIQNNFTNVLSELKNRKSSTDSNNSPISNGKGGIIPPPPPPPMPPPLDGHDPSESRPFLDPYGRAKTVRIGKWRWPPLSDSTEAQIQDSFTEFKLRQHQHQNRKITPQYQEYNDQLDNGADTNTDAGSVDWEEFEIENISAEKIEIHTTTQSTSSAATAAAAVAAITATTTAINVTTNGYKEDSNNNVNGVGEKKKKGKSSKSGFEVGAQRPSPGSIGKLKLSSEMRQRLEKVTANHSVRSTKPNEKPALPRDDIKVNRLEDNRKLLLQQQLSNYYYYFFKTAFFCNLID